MKKSLISYINACVIVGFLCMLPISCEKEPSPASEPTPEPTPVTLTISPTTLPVAESKEDTVKVEVDCNASWNVTSEKDWCKVSPSSGASGKTTVALIVAENTEYDERNTAVTFKSGSETEKITLTQKQKDALLLDSSEKVEVDAVGGNIQIKLRTNIEHSYTIEEGVNWIHEPSKSIYRGLTEREIKLEVDENPELEPRQASVTITAGEYEEKVMVYQNASEPKLVLSKTDYVVASAGDTIRVELRSNSEYSYELPDVNWIKVSESRAMSSYTHYFEVLPNDTYDNREAQIKFVNKENGEELFVNIKQMQLNAIVIAEEEYRFSNEKQLWELEVNTNIDFKAVSSADWMEVMGVEARGLEPKKVYVQIAANDSTDVREATLTLTGEDVTQVIKVIQEPLIVFALSQTEFTVPSAGDTIQVEVTENMGYEFQIPEVDWIKEAESRALSKHVHSFVVMPNDSYDDREAKIKFVNKADDDESFVVVKQMKTNAIVVAQDKYRINSEAKDWDLQVNTNVEFEAKSSADWLKVNQVDARGLVEKKLTLSAEANISANAREATVTLAGEGLVQTIHVVQIGKTDRIKLVVKHEEKTFMTPVIEGENAFGTTDWGDGTKENYAKGRSYTYKIQGKKQATFDIYGAESFTIDKLGSISSLTIYIDKGKNSSVEDVEIDKKEWD